MEKEKILNPARSLCLEQLYHILVKSQTELDIEQGWQEDSPASLVNLLYNIEYYGVTNLKRCSSSSITDDWPKQDACSFSRSRWIAVSSAVISSPVHGRCQYAVKTSEGIRAVDWLSNSRDSSRSQMVSREMQGELHSASKLSGKASTTPSCAAIVVARGRVPRSFI